MRVLVIGGTRFIGRAAVDRLVADGHDVTLFHRGENGIDLFPDLPRVIGDRHDLADHADELRAARPEVVLDMIALSREDARGVLDVFRGVASRTITIFSGDVYAAFGRAVGIEEGEPVPVPFDEDGPLRETRYPYRGRAPRLEDYEKIHVEEEMLGDRALPGTILRLPMVFGPGDNQHRFREWLVRMDDRREAILLDAEAARWRCARVYVEDVAAAVSLCVAREVSAGRIYHVAEPDAPTAREYLDVLAGVVGWSGRVVTVLPETLPEPFRSGVLAAHPVDLDTRRIREEIGYAETVDREDALRRTVAWERETASAEPTDYAAEDEILASLED
jgi:nucleoside-diphosphate-sugar epimerase